MLSCGALCCIASFKDLICLSLAKTTKFQTFFKYNAAKFWNTLPRNLRHDQSLTSFKLKVKQHLSFHLNGLFQ